MGISAYYTREDEFARFSEVKFVSYFLVDKGISKDQNIRFIVKVNKNAIFTLYILRMSFSQLGDIACHFQTGGAGYVDEALVSASGSRPIIVLSLLPFATFASLPYLLSRR